jgi:ElaB/YqjD/DUF883 family membrane-anchored ribosome-binding protein
METNSQTKQTGTFSEKLNKFQQEIEEFALQFSLGKAEATDKFEEIKKKFNARVNEWMNSIKVSKEHSTDKIKSLLEELRIQLELGKAEAKEVYEEQRKKVDHLISELETELKNKPQLKYLLPEIKLEIFKIKLKLQILGIEFKLKQNDLSKMIHEEMNKLRTNFEYLFKNDTKDSFHIKEKIDHFNTEIEKAFDHMKKAIRSFS